MEKFISGKNEFPSASIWKVILSFDLNAIYIPFLVLEIYLVLNYQMNQSSIKNRWYTNT